MALQRAGIEAVIEGYGNFISGISEMSGKVNSFGQEAGTVAGQVAAFGQSVAGYGEALVGLGSKLTIALTTPLLSLGVLVSNAAIEYETAIAGVAKTTDGVVQTTQQLLDGLEDSFPELSQEQLLEKIELIPFSQRLTEVGHELEEAFRSLSLEIPVPATELAKIGEIAGQLGISAENLVEFTRIVAALGVSTELSTEQAALSLGRLVAVFGVAEDEVNTFALNVGGALVALGNNLATTEGPISNFAVRVAGTFSALDIPVQYLLAIGAAITATGSQVEAGGSSIQAALLSLHSILTNAGGVIDNTQEITDATLDLQMAQAQIIKQQETLNKENVSAGTAAVATARLADYTNQVAELQTQLEVLNGTNGLPATGQKLQTLARLTGQSVEELKRLWAEGGTSRAQVFIQFLEGLAAEGENMALVLKDLELDGIRSVRTLLSLAGGVETLQRAVELSTSQFALQGTQVEISNALLEEARIRYSTTESQLQILKNTFTNLAIVVGSQLLPVIVPVAQKIADSILQITSSFEALAPAKKFMVFFGGALLAALGPVITAVGAVTIVVGTLTTALASLIGLGGGLGGVLLGFGSLLFQLSSFDTGIIGTIAANLRAVYDNFVAAIPGGGLYDVLQVLLSQGTGDLPYIKELLYNIRDAIQTPLESAIGGALIAIPYILNSIANIAVQFSGLINSVLLTAISGIDYQGVAQVLLHGFAVVIASVNQHLPSLMQPLKIELFGATLFGADVLDPARPQIIGLAEGIIPMIRGKLAMLVHGVVEFWYTQMDVLAQNIPSIFTVLADAISFGAGAVYDILSAFYDIFDTTKDTIGEFISGMGTQIARLIGIFLDVDQIDLGTTFGTAISSFGDAAAILINTILPAIVEHFTRFVDYVEANGPRIAESLRAMLSGPFLAQVQQFANWIAQNIDQIAKAFLVLQGAIFGLERLRDLGLFLRPFNSAIYNIEITLHSLGQVAGVVGGALGLLAAPFTAVGQAATFALKGISSFITSLPLSLSPLSAFTPSKVVVPVKPVVQLQDVEFPPEYNQQFDRIADAFLASNLPIDGLGIIELPITPKPKLELPDLDALKEQATLLAAGSLSDSLALYDKLLANTQAKIDDITNKHTLKLTNSATATNLKAKIAEITAAIAEIGTAYSAAPDRMTQLAKEIASAQTTLANSISADKLVITTTRGHQAAQRALDALIKEQAALPQQLAALAEQIKSAQTRYNNAIQFGGSTTNISANLKRLQQQQEQMTKALAYMPTAIKGAEADILAAKKKLDDAVSAASLFPDKAFQRTNLSKAEAELAKLKAFYDNYGQTLTDKQSSLAKAQQALDDYLNTPLPDKQSVVVAQLTKERDRLAKELDNLAKVAVAGVDDLADALSDKNIPPISLGKFLDTDLSEKELRKLQDQLKALGIEAASFGDELLDLTGKRRINDLSGDELDVALGLIAELGDNAFGSQKKVVSLYDAVAAGAKVDDVAAVLVRNIGAEAEKSKFQVLDLATALSEGVFDLAGKEPGRVRLILNETKEELIDLATFLQRNPQIHTHGIVDDLVDTKGNVAATTKLKDQLLKLGASTVTGLAPFSTKIQNLFLHPIATISAAFSSVGGGLLSGLGSIASGIVAAFNPVTIIIAAVTGAILALGAAASGLDFSNVFGSLFEGDFTTFFAEIKQGFSNIGEGAKTGIGAVVVAIQPLIDAFKRIGESFGAFSYLADPLADLFNQLAEAGKIIGPQLLTVLGAIAGVIVVLLTGVVSAVAGALPGIAEAIGGIVDILTGIVEIATGVSQVVIGIFTLSGDKIKEGLNNIGAGFGDVFVGIIEVIGGALHAVLGAVLGFTQGISAAIAGIAGALGASGVATFFQNIVNYIDIILQGLQALGSGIGQGLRHAFDSIGDVLGGIGEFVSSIISAFQYLYDVLVGNSIVPDLVMAIVDWFFQLPELVLSVLGQGLLQIATLFGQLGLAILAQINPFLPQMVIMGYDLITGVAKGIIGGAAELGLSLITALHNAIESGRAFLGSHSPSVLAAETLGAPIPQGIAQGIYGSSGEIDAALAGALGGAFANTDVTGQAEAYGHQVASVIASIIGSSGQATPIDVGQASGILNLIPEDALANLSEFNQGVLQTAASAGLAADKFISLALQAGISLEDMKDVISQAALDQKFEELQNAVADGSMSFEDAATSFEHFKSQVEQGVGVVVDVDMSTYLNAKDQFDALEEQGVEVNIIPLPPAKPIRDLLLPDGELPVPVAIETEDAIGDALLAAGDDLATSVSSAIQPTIDAITQEAARLERAAQTRATGVEGGLMGGGAEFSANILSSTTNNLERLRLEYEAIDDTPLVPTFDFTGFEDFNTAASDSFAALPTEAQPHLDQLAINTTATLDTMSASFTTWGGTATGILSTATGDMAAVLSDGDLVNTWSGTLDDMVSATSEKSIAVVDQFREIIAASEIVIGQADFYTLGVNLVAGLIEGIVSQAGAAAEAAGAVVQGAVDAGNAAAQTQSPSKLTYETGQNMSAGLAEGIADGTHQVQEAAQDTVNAAVWEIENPSFSGTTIMDTPLWQQVIGDLALDRGFVTQYFGLIADAANDYTSGNWQGLQGQLAQAVAEANAEAESSTAQTVDSFADAATTMADQFDEIITGGVESTMSNITTLLSAWAVDHSLEEILGFADTFSSAGSTFADMFTEQVLDPLQELIDEATEAQDQVVSDFGELFDDITSEDLIGRWFNADDPLIADLELEELWKRALGDIFGDEAVKNLNLEELQQLILDTYGANAAQTLQLQELFTDDELALINDYIQAQQERLRLEEEFAAEQERVLALQQQQQQLEFLQQQFDLIQAITDAGLDPAEILDGITLGLDASLPDLIEAMTVAMQALVTAANEELQIQSPSKVFMGISKQIIGGLTGGLTKYGGQAVSAMTSVLQGVSGSYTPYPTVMGNSHYNSTVDKSVHIKVDANYGKSQSPATIKADLLSLTGVVW